MFFFNHVGAISCLPGFRPLVKNAHKTCVGWMDGWMDGLIDGRNDTRINLKQFAPVNFFNFGGIKLEAAQVVFTLPLFSVPKKFLFLQEGHKDKPKDICPLQFFLILWV